MQGSTGPGQSIPTGSMPSGAVTFLFTDIEGSTSLWEQYSQAMGAAVARHDNLLRQTIEAHEGYVFKTVGDAFCAAFSRPLDALVAALAAQRALLAEDWASLFSPQPQPGDSVLSPQSSVLRVRMALHTGMAEERDGDYFGPALNRLARLLSAAHGGQTLLSSIAQGLLRDHLPPGVELRDLGEHRLKDLYLPERAFQLVTPDLPSEFPLLKTLDSRPNNLPIERTLLIGREKELADVQKLLLRPDVPLLTLTGAGGSGKTRLALQVAAEAVDHFHDGVFFVNLAPLADPNLVLPTIAQTLGVKEAPGQPIIETLKNYLRDRQMLLLLDNFEQVAEAAPQVNQLPAGSPNLKMLVTSRVPLRVRGEYEYTVPPLQLPNPKQLPPLEKLTQYEAVRLFIERAQAIKADFEVNNDNAPAVAEICVRLDGLPLAIELAAARIRLLPPQAMLARLDSRLKLLTGGARDLPARQQTLRSTIAWSYDLLDEGEQQLFRRMAVFQGGSTLEAADAVCNSDSSLKVYALDGVSSLVEKSLLYQLEGAEGEPRFYMLETIHEYGREKLEESGEGEELRRQHALYFMALAEEAEPELTGAQQVEWLTQLQSEYDNIRAALQWATGGGRNTELGLRLVGALWQFWWVRGYLVEAREQLMGVLPGYSREATDAEKEAAFAKHSMSNAISSHIAKVLLGMGRLETEQGNYDAARSFNMESLKIYRRVENKGGIADSLCNLGILAEIQEDYTSASSFFAEALTIRRDLRDKSGIARSLNNLGLVAHQQGDYTSALSLYEESLALHGELGNKWGSAIALNNLGLMARDQGKYESAISFYRECLELYTQLGAKPNAAWILKHMGFAAEQQRDYARALSMFTESMAIWREQGDKQGVEMCLRDLAVLAESEGALGRAVCIFGASEALCEAFGISLDPDDKVEYERSIATARRQLSEEEFEKAWAEGRAMSMEEAIALALEPLPEPEPQPQSQTSTRQAPASAYPNNLTKREAQVLKLVADGLTDPQIAARLSISVRTVEAHLYSIYNKLGVTTRTEAARFAFEHGLTGG